LPGLLVTLQGGLQPGIRLGRIFHQVEQPIPVARRQADDFLPLDDFLRLFQRSLHQKLVDRGARQFGGTAQGFINLVGHASADAILLGNGGSHHHLLR